MLQAGTYRLADSTVVEPLMNNWAVWADIISPAPYSLHLLHYQIKTLSSYIANPQIHIKASRNPKFMGGPFVDIPLERADEVKDFLKRTEENLSENITFAKNLTAFYDHLNEGAKGQSLEAFYQQMPESMRGYAELLYDYYSHPIVRLLESFLYASPYYRPDLQSMRILEQKSDRSRPFFLNTPRLLNDSEVGWNIPFASPSIDEFFKLDVEPQPLNRIGDLLGLDANSFESMMPLLTSEPHPRPAKQEHTGVRIRYFGHACVLIEWNGVSVLTDPWIGIRSTEEGTAHFSYDDLPEKINFAIITHSHHDHFVPETLLRLRHKIECLIVPRTFGLFYTDTSLKLLARKLGFKNVVEMDALESIKVSAGEIIAIPSEGEPAERVQGKIIQPIETNCLIEIADLGNKVPAGEIIAAPFFGEHADLAHGKMAYVIRAGTEHILFAADSNCLDKRMYEHLRKFVGPIETVFLGMECVGAPLSWMYGALLPTKLQHDLDQTRRTKGSNSQAAMDMLDAVGGKRVYIYAMGNEPWLQYGMGLGLPEDSVQVREADTVVALAREKGFIDAQRPYCMFETFL